MSKTAAGISASVRQYASTRVYMYDTAIKTVKDREPTADFCSFTPETLCVSTDLVEKYFFFLKINLFISLNGFNPFIFRF